VVPILLDRRLGLFDAFEASWQFNHEDMIKMLALIGILVGVGLLITAFGVGIGFFFFFPFAVLVLMVRYMLRTEQPIAVPHSARYREKAMA
jgi:uncharacterized membrane protein